MASDNEYDNIPIISTWNLFKIAYVLRMPQWYLLKELDRILWGGGHGGTRKPKPLGGLFAPLLPTHIISHLCIRTYIRELFCEKFRFYTV